MQYREDNKSGNKLSALGFGCMRFPSSGNKIDMGKAEQLLIKAYEAGINYYDTAYMYPGSEEAIGRIFEKNKIRDKVCIATKLPQYMCRTAEDIDKFFNTEKERLRTDYIDYYLMHNISELKQWEHLCSLGITEWIRDKKKSGEIRRIGFSFHGSQDEFSKMLDAYEWDFVQIQYNYMNTHYQAGTKGLKEAASKGIPVIIMEPLLGGKLANNLPKDAVKVMGKAKPGSTPVSWALRWLWNHPEVTVILSGMNEMKQLEENISISEEALPGCMSGEEERTIKEVIDVFNKSYKIRCTGCNYCMPCPQKINIPSCFAAYNASYAIDLRTGVMQYMMSTGSMGDTPHLASDCVKCGKCEAHCPQRIEIRKELKAVKRRLQIPGVKKIVPIAKKIMGKMK